MDTLIQFGTADEDVYIFDEGMFPQVRPTFGDFTPQTAQVIGMHGGFNAGGRGAARSSIGNVQAFLWLMGANAYEMGALRIALDKIGAWGEQRLFKRHQSAGVMWTWAVLNNQDANQAANAMPHKRLQVQMNFQCPRARWYRKPDDVLSAAGAYTAGGIRSSGNSVANGSTVTVVNNGSAEAGLYVKWTSPGGVTMTNPTITRKDSAANILQSIQYTGALAPAATWEADGRNHQLNGGASSTDFSKLTKKTGDWLTLKPGSNTLYITGTFSGGNGTLDLDWWDTYF